ncbi:hypothetical protein ACFPZN_10675 [Actinomadura rugatobispora]|uniref:Uncharacterized protein n=1 Tax=Actinomadura rugatobispora TaxID=1994 RepID=A0ABW0ZS36_9ACTN|nr:hypothetical protein GCM10010200_076170 [Actinomadura rugatobispora]
MLNRARRRFGDELHDPDEAEQLVCGDVRSEGAVGGGSLDGSAADGSQMGKASLKIRVAGDPPASRSIMALLAVS